MNNQLPLKLQLKDGSSFANYYPGANRDALRHVESVARGGDQALFLSGVQGSGKTHLLQAACRVAGDQGSQSVYIPCRELDALDIDILENIEGAPLVCLDDVDGISGQSEWESPIFALCERLRGAGGRLLASARSRPQDLELQLADLKSRLSWGAMYLLHPLEDEEKIAAIRLRAHNRALEIGDEAVRYILNQYPRDMHSLFTLLERIDDASLTQKRRVTIPFLRSLEPARRE
jgi:DnaA family protein